MKPFLIAISFFLTLLAGLSLNAQKLYTWTDENGVVHLSDQPPPEKDTVENFEVTRYNEKTPQELEAIENEKETLRRKFDKEEQIDKARQAEIKAKEAEELAQKAVQQALEEYEHNKEYIRYLTSTRNKRIKFKKRVDRLKAESEASRAEAEAAVEKAEKAAQAARTAAQKAQIDPQ